MANESTNYRVDESTTIEASADLSASQYQVVGLDANGQSIVYDGTEASNPASPVGVQLDAPTAKGMPSNVQTRGIAKVLVGTAGVTGGKEVQMDTTGKAETFVVPAVGNSKWTLGTALLTRTSGQYVPVQVNISRADNNS